ncbi:50S ribosomal protein L13 [Candidatus Woesearchaeota archaeon]|nr:50S ribosomal protein L13 [Candidatus Woesearchaeota archaeon]
MKTVIDAQDLILGRMATKIAKRALLGEEVIVVNCELAVISGKKADIIAHYKKKFARGVHTKGPFFPRQPERMVRRIIRGMLPWKRAKGREAFKRVMCYMGIPEEFRTMEIETIKEAHINRLKTMGMMRIKEVCSLMGAKL